MFCVLTLLFEICIIICTIGYQLDGFTYLVACHCYIFTMIFYVFFLIFWQINSLALSSRLLTLVLEMANESVRFSVALWKRCKWDERVGMQRRSGQSPELVGPNGDYWQMRDAGLSWQPQLQRASDLSLIAVACTTRSFAHHLRRLQRSFLKPRPVHMHQQQCRSKRQHCRSNIRLCCHAQTATMSNEFIVKFRPFDKVECCFNVVRGGETFSKQVRHASGGPFPLLSPSPPLPHSPST